MVVNKVESRRGSNISLDIKVENDRRSETVFGQPEGANYMSIDDVIAFCDKEYQNSECTVFSHPIFVNWSVEKIVKNVCMIYISTNHI